MSDSKWINVKRREYVTGNLREEDALSDPMFQFRKWLDEVLDAGVPGADEMVLSTATPQGRPSSRYVLLKGIDDRGFVFASNYNSRKGRELDANPHAAICIYWGQFERQVRMEGLVEKTSREDSIDYFNSRPRGAQLGAWTSKQSQPVSSREEIEREFAEIQKSFEGREIPCPPYWGGYRLVPERIEFWQGGEHRLHDRLVYTREENRWKITRLSP